MKRYYIIVIALLGVVISGCSDFMERYPLTSPNSEQFLSGHPQVENYINGLYTSLPSLPKFGMGQRGEEKNSDNILAENYDKRLNGELNLFDGSKPWQDGYINLRSVNYFFSYYRIPEESETSEIKSLKGEAYFLRAYWHFYLLTQFGEIPIMDDFWDNKASIAELQIPAASRTEVVNFILRDLEEASKLLFPRSKYQGLRINKEAALIFAMRVALYEGTWQKYHQNTAFNSSENNSESFLQNVIDLGDELFAMKTINLHTDNNSETEGVAFGQLFNQKDLSAISEAVFWKKYSNADGVFHALSGLLGAGVVDQDGPAGLSGELVNNYLNADGSFINPKDSRFKDFNKTFIDRDSRLTQVVMSSNAKFKSTDKGSKPLFVEEYSEENKGKINPPYLKGDGQGRNITGYHIRLGVDETFLEGNGDTPFIMIRFAEALLCYAEASEELNKCDDQVLEKTLKPLRERAGVKYIKPQEIDPNFTDYGYSLTPNLQEIRRERRSELALQGFRFDDLMRWRGHKAFQAKRGRGAYLGEDGVLYKSFSKDDAELLGKILVDENGWMDPLQQYLPGGYQFNDKRDYLLPIPPEELALNKQLKQNPNWN